MPSWPTGVQTCSINFGKGITAAGNITSATLNVDPMFVGTDSIVWANDGTPLLPFTETTTANEGAYGTTAVPVVDQTGWLDAGQHAFTMWGYKLTETPKYGTTVGKQRIKYWQPLTGQTAVDFDLIPDGTLGLPVTGPVASVISVNGQTGVVTVESGIGDIDQLPAATGVAPGDAIPVVQGGVTKQVDPDVAVNALLTNPASATATTLSGTYLTLPLLTRDTDGVYFPAQAGGLTVDTDGVSYYAPAFPAVARVVLDTDNVAYPVSIGA